MEKRTGKWGPERKQTKGGGVFPQHLHSNLHLPHKRTCNPGGLQGSPWSLQWLSARISLNFIQTGESVSTPDSKPDVIFIMEKN